MVEPVVLIVIGLALTPLVSANVVFITEILLGARPARPGKLPNLVDPGSVVVLVPAHNEAANLATVLRAQRASLPAGMRLLVIADNCTDKTADIARAAGFDVVERHDPSRRGKGFAMAFGRAILADHPPECVIVVDADTVPALGSLERLAIGSLGLGRPVQGAYILEPTIEHSPVARFSAASFYVKNVVRQLGAQRIGAPALLTGSGMAFPWSIFAKLPLDTSHVAEDLMLGVSSALSGAAPIFEPHAWIIGEVSSTSGTAVQRRRWESGFVQVGCDYVKPLIARAFTLRELSLFWLALHLGTPPLILLLAADAAATLVAGAAWIAGTSAAAFTICLGMLVAAVAAVPFSLACHGRLDLLRDWHEAPGYILWKLRLSVVSIICREQSWIRTDRE